MGFSMDVPWMFLRLGPKKEPFVQRQVLGKDFVVSSALLQQMCAKEPELLHTVLSFGAESEFQGSWTIIAVHIMIIHEVIIICI